MNRVQVFKEVEASSLDPRNISMGSLTAGGSKDTAFLKLAVILLNERQDEDHSGQLYTLEDFDHLTSEQMLKIIVTIMREIIGDLPIVKHVPLTEFNKFGVGELTYDAGIDQIYHAVRRIFPEEDELFHYSVLLQPAKDPRRTKAVLTYIMTFFWMVDCVHDAFNQCYIDVAKENEEKVAICAEIDELTDKITELIQKRQTEKERLPLLQKEMRGVEEKIKKESTTLAKLNEEAQKKKEIFDVQEAKVTELQKQMEQLEADRLHLEGQVVHDLSSIQAENLSLKKQIDAQQQEREAKGAQINVLKKKGDGFDGLIELAKDAIGTFLSTTTMMENAKSKITSFTKSENSVNSQGRIVEQLRLEVKALEEAQEQKLQEIKELKERFDKELSQRVEEIKRLRVETRTVSKRIEDERAKASSFGFAIDEINLEIGKLKKEITQYMHIIMVDLPQRRKLLHKKVDETLEVVADKLGSYPLP